MLYTLSMLALFVLAVTGFAVGFHNYRLYGARYRIKPQVAAGIYFSLLIALFLVQAILFWPANADQVYGELAALSGAALGWPAGMYLSPVGSGESTKFSRYWTAIGVGSGFTLKWGIDKLAGYTAWFHDHAFVSLLFAIAFVITTAAVYYNRAYSDALSIAPRTPLSATFTMEGGVAKITHGASVQFYTAVTGPSDPLASWQVFPAALGTVDANGLFTADGTPGTGRITAFNLEDPTLSNSLNIQVT